MIGVDVTAAAVGAHYGARSAGGLLDGWLVDSADADAVPVLEGIHLSTRAVPLMMTDLDATRAIATATLELGRRTGATVA